MSEHEGVAGVRRRLREHRATRKTAWAELERLRQAALAAGPRAMSPKSAEFRALDQAGRKYDDLCDEIASDERFLAQMSEMSLTSGRIHGAGTNTRAGVDIDGFMAAFNAWSADPAVAAAIGGGHAQIGRSPAFPLIAKEMFAAAVSFATYPSQTYRVPGAEPLPQPNLALLPLINFVPTDFDQIEYMAQTIWSANAAETAEGAAAPEATVVYEAKKTSVRSIPLHLPVGGQVLDDTAAFEALISGQLVSGVLQRLQAQIIAGDGIGDNLLGIVEWPDVLVQDMGSNTVGDVIQRAVAKIRNATLSLYEPNVILLHPDDALELGLVQDDVHGYVFSPAARYLWGLLPVVHSSVPEGTPIVGDTRACQGYTREDATVAITKSHLDHFTKRIVDLLASGRWAFAVRCPSAWCLLTDFQS